MQRAFLSTTPVQSVHQSVIQLVAIISSKGTEVFVASPRSQIGLLHIQLWNYTFEKCPSVSQLSRVRKLIFASVILLLWCISVSTSVMLEQMFPDLAICCVATNYSILFVCPEFHLAWTICRRWADSKCPWVRWFHGEI